jgi:hypothetical protein
MISIVPSAATDKIASGRKRVRGSYSVGALLGVAIFSALSVIRQESFVRYIQFDTSTGSNEVIRTERELAYPPQRAIMFINDSASPTTGITLAATPSPQPRISRNITLIVEFQGELGNYLSKLASARITQLIAQRNYPHINIQLIGQHHNQAKWTLARDDLVRCFPTFRNFEFEGGIHDTNNDFATIKQIQESWLNTNQRKKLSNVRSLTFLDSLLYQQEQNMSDAPQLPPTNGSWKYSLPYLTSNSFSLSEVLRDEYYYNDIRKWMRFNETACCNPDQAPNSNEIVFHYRNFATELQNNRNAASRFMEVTPNTAANVLFLNTIKSHPIAIVSRFETGVDQYLQAFQERGLSAHYVIGQRSGMEAFCYLKQAQYQIVGSGQSTFFLWATYLGNATMNRLYLLDQQQIQPSNETVLPLPNRTITTIQREHRTFTTEVC